VVWYLPDIGAPVVCDCEESTTLKRVVLRDMQARREKEHLRGSNPDWSCVRLAAVLCNPFTKTFTFGNKPGTAALARARALAVMKRMVERAESEKVTPTPLPPDGSISPPTKRPRFIFRRLRSFATGVDEQPGGDVRSSRVSSRSSLALEAEWEASLA